MLLEGKRALVTGSRRGIGAAIATALAREGCDVGLNDTERDADAETTIAGIEALGRRVTFTAGDISRADDVNRIFDEFLAAHGGIDILVNNPYWCRNQSFLEIDEETWDRTMDVCVKGYFLCGQRAAREMAGNALPDGLRAVRGNIISISSVHAYRAWPDDTAYGVAKAAVVRMTMSMALDLAEHRIHCHAIAPGYIDSRVLPPEREHERGHPEYESYAAPAIASRRIGVPEDIAGAAVFLCSGLGAYCNGHTLKVDGGFLVAGTPD